jgi:hypothetical protein
VFDNQSVVVDDDSARGRRAKHDPDPDAPRDPRSRAAGKREEKADAAGNNQVDNPPSVTHHSSDRGNSDGFIS